MNYNSSSSSNNNRHNHSSLHQNNLLHQYYQPLSCSLSILINSRSSSRLLLPLNRLQW